MLRLRGLTHHYPGQPQPALAGIDLDIPTGGVFGLLGPNGAGKTTLIALLAGLLTPAAGQISFKGRPLDETRRQHPNAIALVPQDQAFYPMLTVAENLRFFAGVLALAGSAAQARIEQAVGITQLQAFTRQRAETLSGGLRRRLNLAIGLLGDPQLLLLDEPTVGVDPQSRAFLLDSIRQLAVEGRTVIYTSHYMDEVETLCTRLAILDHGRVLASGALDALLQDGGTGLALRLPRAVPEAVLTALQARWPALAGAGEQHLAADSLPAAELPELLARLQEAGLPPLSISYGQHSLDGLFMRLTRRSLRD